MCHFVIELVLNHITVKCCFLIGQQVLIPFSSCPSTRFSYIDARFRLCYRFYSSSQFTRTCMADTSHKQIFLKLGNS